MPYTEGSLLELKNTYRNNFDKSGWFSEFLVACDLVQKGYLLKKHRFKTAFAEIDLLLLKRDVLVLVEVKTATRVGWGESCLSASQLLRLRRGALYLSSKYDCEVLSLLALVDRSGEIEYSEGFLE